MTAYELYTEACRMAFRAQCEYNTAHHDVRTAPSVKNDLRKIADVCNREARRLGRSYSKEFSDR